MVENIPEFDFLGFSVKSGKVINTLEEFYNYQFEYLCNFIYKWYLVKPTKIVAIAHPCEKYLIRNKKTSFNKFCLLPARKVSFRTSNIRVYVDGIFIKPIPKGGTGDGRWHQYCHQRDNFPMLCKQQIFILDD